MLNYQFHSYMRTVIGMDKYDTSRIARFASRLYNIYIRMLLYTYLIVAKMQNAIIRVNSEIA